MFENKSSLLEGKRIFLIEDDVMNLAVFARVLNQNRAIVYENYNTIGVVVHVIQNLPIDLILLDIMLRRGINGYDVFEQLRQNPETSRIPIVAVTSLDPEPNIHKAQVAGFDGFISKPINTLTFANDLAAVINGGKKMGHKPLISDTTNIPAAMKNISPRRKVR